MRMISLLLIGLLYWPFSSIGQEYDSTGNLVNNIRGTSGHDVWLGTGAAADLGGAHPITVYGCCSSISGSSPLLDTSTLNGNGQSGQIIWSYGQTTVNYIVNTLNALPGSGLRIHGYYWGYELRNMNGDDRQSSVDTLVATSRLWNSTYTGSLASETRTHNTKMEWTAFTSTVTLASPQSISNVGNLQLSFTSGDSGNNGAPWAGYYGPQIRNVDARLLYSVDPCVLNPLYASHCPGFNDIVTSGNLIPYPGGFASWGQSLNQTFAISTALLHGGLGVKVHGFNWGYDLFVGNTYCADFFCTDWRDPNVTTNVNITDDQGNSIYSITRKGQYDDKEYWVSYNYSYVLPQTINSLSLGNFQFTAQTQDYAGITNMRATIQYTPDQCVTNPLYNSGCTDYQNALAQCSINPLYASYCDGYQVAMSSCSANQLNHEYCLNYQNTLNYCSTNPLSNDLCPTYPVAVDSCNANQLNHNYCPNYQTTLNLCSTNPLSNDQCQGHQTAVNSCNQNQLNHEYCPNYQATYDACSTNPLSNKLCPGYDQAFALQMLESQKSESAEAEPTISSTVSVVQAETQQLDPTRSESKVTVDAGGVELSISGEMVIPTGQTEAAKEAAKESELEQANKEEEKKRPDPRALAQARSAAAAATRLAESRAQESVELSQLDQSVSDAIGLGTGITLQGFRPMGLDQEETTSSDRSSTQNNLNLQAGNDTKSKEVPGSQPPTGPSVRRGGAVEGMEGGASMAELARAPLDFNQYLNSQLKDSRFYESREIYRGQRTVDNARAQRFLNAASDKLHQEMVDQQYGK